MCQRDDAWKNLTFERSALIASASPVLDAARTAAGGWSTTYARGNSPLNSSGTGTTHTSATSGWLKRWPSSSAGATWKPRTLINSYRRGWSVLVIVPGEVPYHLETIDNIDVALSIVFDLITRTDPSTNLRLQGYQCLLCLQKAYPSSRNVSAVLGVQRYTMSGDGQESLTPLGSPSTRAHWKGS